MKANNYKELVERLSKCDDIQNVDGVNIIIKGIPDLDEGGASIQGCIVKR